MSRERPHLVVLSGAGMSAESGIRTFRDSNGLWEEYRVEDVASPEGWFRDSELVTRFYNERRRQLCNAQPNEGHKGLAALESFFKVSIITQNIDNLHERAGSTSVIHLHGELTKARSTVDPSLVYDIGYKDLSADDKCEKGSRLRPHIVWFGEAVPAMDEAITTVEQADIFLVIGTSLVVYPAAGLINYAPSAAERYLIDPNNVPLPRALNFYKITAGASEGVKAFTEIIKKKYGIG
ncbi:MAG TPA: NAD-dependent deacylase [Bacteroidales bacterium]|nr:NAD-dependent deacylase [Bacteroidales bacterium]